MERGNRRALPAAQAVGPLGERVGAVLVLVQPVRQRRRDGAHCAHAVEVWLPVAIVILVQLMATNREVDGGRLVCVHVHRVGVGVLLGWHTIGVLNREYLQDEVWRRIRGLRRGR